MEITAVSTRPGSARLRDFAVRHGIPRVLDDWRAMLAEPKVWDALLIAAHTDGTADVLSKALDLDIPILVEKPVAMSSAKLADLSAKSHDRVIVGYNRRFYRPVRKAREEVRQGPPLLAQLCLPEGIFPSNCGDPTAGYLRPFFENSCHGLDLARFVLGNLRVDAVQYLRTATDQLSGLAAVLSTERGDILQFMGNWGAPANFGLSLNRPGRRFDLCPLELATIYEGMDVVEPSDACPIRRYLPREASRILLDDIDLREKPGFVAQATALSRMIDGDPPPEEAATLSDALAAIKLCEELTGLMYLSC